MQVFAACFFDLFLWLSIVKHCLCWACQYNKLDTLILDLIFYLFWCSLFRLFFVSFIVILSSLISHIARYAPSSTYKSTSEKRTKINATYIFRTTHMVIFAILSPILQPPPFYLTVVNPFITVNSLTLPPSHKYHLVIWNFNCIFVAFKQ